MSISYSDHRISTSCQPPSSAGGQLPNFSPAPPPINYETRPYMHRYAHNNITQHLTPYTLCIIIVYMLFISVTSQLLVCNFHNN